MKCEVIEDEKKNYFSKTTAQVYKDCLYVYGIVDRESDEVWSFDLSMTKLLWEIIDLFIRKPHLEAM